MNIPIFFACDDNYFYPLSVVVESIIRNCNDDTRYDFYCLHDGIQESKRNQLQHYLKKDNLHSINFIFLEQKLENVHVSGHLSKMTYARLLATDYFTDLDKILYLDIDTLVLGDLTELFATDVSNNELAATRDVINGSHIPNFYGRYYSAGVALLNLAQMRKNNTNKKLMELINSQTQYKYHDQDMLNIACAGQIVELPLQYNYPRMFASNLRLVPESDIEIFEREHFPLHEFNAHMQKAPVILHYSGYKPWNNHFVPMQSVWMKYYKLSSVSQWKLPRTQLKNKIKNSKEFFYTLKLGRRFITLFLLPGINLPLFKVSFYLFGVTRVELGIGARVLWNGRFKAPMLGFSLNRKQWKEQLKGKI